MRSLPDHMTRPMGQGQGTACRRIDGIGQSQP